MTSRDTEIEGAMEAFCLSKGLNPAPFLDVIRRSQPASEPSLDVDRLTAIIESRMSRDLAWLRDDGKTVDRFTPEQVAWGIAHLYDTGDVVSGLPSLTQPADNEAAK